MSKHDDGGPAFPFGQVSELTGMPVNGYHNDGMSLLDYFAGQAFQTGLIEMDRRGIIEHNDHAGWAAAYRAIARAAYEAADAMIAEKRRLESEASDAE